MSEKEKLLEDLKEPIQAMQGVNWTELCSQRPVSAPIVSKIGCLVNAYQRITPKGLGEMPVKQLEEFLTLTKRIQGVVANSVRQGYRPDLGSIEKECDAALPVVQECADRGAANKARRKEVETLLAEMRVQQGEVNAAAAELRSQQKEAQASFRKTVDEMNASVRQKTESMEERVTQLGASLHAAFFKREADKHEKAAEVWKKGVWVAAAVLAVYAVASIFLPAIPWLEDVPPLQLAVSKTLVFIVLGYALLFCARNYAAERHNAVVNRHRHNALMTYRALVRANKNLEGADIVLTQAARFIYAPQDSGYARGGGDGGGDVSVFENVRRAANAVKRGGNE